MYHSPLSVIDRLPESAQTQILYNLDLAIQIEPRGTLAEELLIQRSKRCWQVITLATANGCTQSEIDTLLLASGFNMAYGVACAVKEPYQRVSRNRPCPIANLSREIERRRFELSRHMYGHDTLS
ncbi:MAG TPA: hypothetical protein VJB82_00420 [Candidatus Peribacterales bacterium]|nr:hypothetical protein [Candidatus Peribacterales bacterium]